jgi:uncharacterized Zn finger protein (UPF0148 family)
MLIAKVNPAYTSKNCSRCGLRGVRKRHSFTCPSCGFSGHSDYVECSRTSLKTLQNEGALSPHNQSYDGIDSIPRNIDLNAAVNIRNRSTAFRSSGVQSIIPEAQA